jgi:hypothetical protein
MMDRRIVSPEERCYDLALRHLLIRRGLNSLGVPYLT